MAIERVKPIEFDYDGKHYTLMYNRRSIQKMEEDGFDINKANVKIASCVYKLFSGAFLAKHKFVTEQEKEKMFDLFTKKSDKVDDNGERETLSQRLMALYVATVNSLIDGNDGDQDDENLIRWS